VSPDEFRTKWKSLIRQLGFLFTDTFWTDFFNKGPTKTVACLTSDYSEKVRYSKVFQEGTPTCCSRESNPGRYHKTIRPFTSTTVRGSENSPKFGFGYSFRFLSFPNVTCWDLYRSTSQGIVTVQYGVIQSQFYFNLFQWHSRGFRKALQTIFVRRLIFFPCLVSGETDPFWGTEFDNVSFSPTSDLAAIFSNVLVLLL
jgi:hypothetical protein